MTKKGMCFVLMPFGGEYDHYYEHIYKPVIEDAGYEARRADDISQPTEIMADIWESIQNAAVLMADLSGKNPNVFYELGLAHAIAKPVILITPSADNIPFDLKHIRYICFNTRSVGWENRLKSEFSRMLHNQDLTRCVPHMFKPKDMTLLLSQSLSASLQDALKPYNKISKLKILAHSTNSIRSIMWDYLHNIYIDSCEILVRKYSDEELNDNYCKKEQTTIDRNIQLWERLKNDNSINLLNFYYQESDLTEYFIIINEDILIQGVYSYSINPRNILPINMTYSRDKSKVVAFIQKFEQTKKKTVY